MSLEPPHDQSNNITCNDCHAMHRGGFIPRNEQQEALCKTCHNPTGTAAAKSSVANHIVDDGDTIVDCGCCHDAHNPHIATDPHSGGQTATNLSLIRFDTAKYIDAALEPAIFQQKPAHFAFDENSAPWVGICQSCHTKTSYHTNNAAADHHHQMPGNCISCHTHEDGFAPSGGSCLECHSVPQNNRRQLYFLSMIFIHT